MLKKIGQWVCNHSNHSEVLKTDGDRMYTECTGCLKQSQGVQFGITPKGERFVYQTASAAA